MAPSTTGRATTEAPSLHRHYPASAVLRASPPPQTVRPGSHELPVDQTAITAGASRVASGPLCLHAVANTPAGPTGSFARTLPSTAAFPRFSAGQLLHHPFRGLHSVHFRYGLQTRQVAKATLYTRGFSSFVTSTTAPIATGWSEPVPGWVFLPTEDQRLFTAHEKSGLGMLSTLKVLCPTGWR